MTILGAAAAAFSCLFVLSFGYAQHAPHPHDVRIDVVAPTGVAEQVRHSLDAAAPGGFDVRPVATETRARQHLEHMTTSGALVEAPGGEVRLLTASAAGLPLQQAVTNALSSVAHAQGHDPQLVDVVPLPDGDRGGISSFALELGLLVPAVVGAIGFFLMGRRARIWIRVAGAVAYAVLAAALATVMLDAALGALTGAPWALFGDAVMISGAFVLTVVALHCLFGLPGTALAAGALFVVGNAINGVAVPTSMLPDVYRQIAPWVPNNAAVHLVRSDTYFDGHDQGGPLLTLTIWLAAAVLIVAATDLVHAKLRRGMPVSAQEIYATPLLANLRRRRDPARPSSQPPAVPNNAAAEVPSIPDAPPASPDSVRVEVGETSRTPAVVVTVAMSAGERQ
ncbi:MAG TPA: hypothetical protein VE442_07875 [Jatrophihabitans sp.]|jgi:hypothetical protein|nr:hypothetical protein [Jatrophihabitans sp.]